MRATTVLAGIALLSLPAQVTLAARWKDVGNEGTSTDAVMVDTDSIEIQGRFRIVSVMTVYPVARKNVHDVLMDRHVQKTAIDCANRAFVGIQTMGFLNGKQIGTSAETADWQDKMTPLKTDPFSNRVLSLVCSKSSDDISDNRTNSSVSKPKIVSGSGMLINTDGYVLTNNHVVRDCTSITVKPTDLPPIDAEISATDRKNDLAILKTHGTEQLKKAVLFRLPSRTVRLGESIGVVGFPLTGFLSTEPKATFGQVSSVAGVNNDYTILQISAPIQPGNSGGPVLDESGAVIGIVVSQASMAMAAIAGNVPQNVNFAIKGEIAQIFLAAQGVKYSTSVKTRKLATEQIAAIGQASTLFILCTQH